ncbi:MAG: glycosyltransferase family 39 protein, partial [Alphaproteobacteria bacterium]|nr:glycosyltransferase family 39 protein [Alphaproteobacteria bacterium]
MTASFIQTNRSVVAIIFVGMLLRIIWALYVPVEPVSDSKAYATFALNIWQHGVYGWTPDEPTAYWAVGTSALTAASFFLLGNTFVGVVFLNLLTGLAILVLTWGLGVRFFGERSAFWAVVLVAFWPNMIFFTSILSSELYFMALTMGGLFFWSNTAGRPWLNLLLAALIWGLACYIRPVILLFPVAMVIAALSQGWQATLFAAIKAAVCVILIILIVSPWTARNETVIGKAYLVSSNFGTNLWMGNNPESDGGYTPLPSEVSGMSEVEREEYLGQKAKDYILENPRRFAITVGKRLIDLHSRETIGVVWNQAALVRYVGDTGVFLLKLVASGYWVLLVLCGLAGV